MSNNAPMSTAAAYYSLVGFSAGMLLTLLLFVYLLTRRIAFPGADALRHWTVAIAGTLLASIMLNLPVLGTPAFYLVHVLTFALLYLANFQFQAGFLVMHQQPRQRGVLPLGTVLVVSYALILSYRNEFWIRLAASASMQIVVWSISIASAARLVFSPQQRAFSPWLSLIGVSLALAGAVLRVYSAWGEPVVPINFRVGGLSAMRDYGFTLAGILIGSLGLVLGCFEKVLDLTRHAENTDALTGLPNRRAIVATGSHEVEHAGSHRRHLVLALVDIDGLKRINEIHGHDAGDQVLVELGRLIVPVSRRRELFGRYSDENFCLVCPDASDALAEGLRLQHRLQDYEFWRVGKVTISIGLASLPVPAGTVDWHELVRQAGLALNQAKRLGGGRCAVYAEPERQERLPA